MKRIFLVVLCVLFAMACFQGLVLGKENVTSGYSVLSLTSKPVAVGSPHGSVFFDTKAYSPDGKLYVCEVEPRYYGNIGIFDANTHEVLNVIDIQQNPSGDYANDVKGLAWSPDSKRIAVMYHHGGGGSIAIVDIKEGFEQWLCLQNPNSVPAYATVYYMIRGWGNQVGYYSIGPNTRETVSVNEAIGKNKEVSMKVICNQPIIAERPIYFGYKGEWTGGHNVIGANSASNVWYFAEGYTGDGFDEWLTLQNPNTALANVTIIYMFRGGGTKVKNVNIGANSRETISVNSDVGFNKEVSMKVESDQKIIAERPMYFNYQGKYQGGHDVIGATSSSKVWYFAEGYTGDGFDEWLCLQNPNSVTANITVTYMFIGGETKTQVLSVGSNARETISVNSVVGEYKEVSMKVESDQEIIAERPMYFNYQGEWQGGHNVIGATSPSEKWYFAEGYTGSGFHQWLTLQNPNSVSTNVTIEYQYRGGGGTAQYVNIGANSRETISVNSAIGSNKEISVKVSSVEPIVVERPMYFKYMNKWNGGHDAIGAVVPSEEWYFAEGYTGQEAKYINIDQFYHYMEFSPDGTKIIAEGDTIDIK